MTDRTKTLTRFVGLDAALVALACMVPAASHVLALPLYMLNPMLALLLAGLLLGERMLAGGWRNALVLAVLMPLVSCFVVGMPTAGKMLCMMAELATVALLFGWLKSRWSVLPAVLVSVLAAKGVYYGLKALVLAPAVLVGTAWWMQLAAVLLWCGVFAMLYKRLK